MTIRKLAPLALMVNVLMTSAAATAEINNVTVEPQSWWADMQNSQLQLLVYGEGISAYEVKLVESANVALKAVHQSASNNHLFIDLDLKDAKPQTIKIGLFDNNQLVQTLEYPIQARTADSRQREGFSNKDVIYLITPDRFVNGNPDNDNHPDMLETANRDDKDGRHGGDILGIRQSLPYFKDLGITQLWINPLLENNQAQYSYHGYSTTNFYKIDPRFGSNEEYKSLVEEAKQFGIGIIKDVIVNHMGSGHRWMADFPTSTWINGQQKWQQNPQDIMYTSHRRTTVQDPYAMPSDTAEFENGWFTDTMPDMNQGDQFMAKYLIQNSIWWIEYAGLSGIREDTYSYADKSFLTTWSKAIMDEYPNFNIVGEEWSDNPITVSYWQAGKHNADGYVSHTPSMMDFPLYEELIKSLTDEESWGSGLINLYETLANDVVYAKPTDLVLFEGNHDTNRLYSLMNNDLALYKMAMAYVLTSNRIPQIFYGTEVLMQSPTKDRNDGLVRSDLPGGFAEDKLSVFKPSSLSAQQQDALAFNRALLNYRKNSLAIQQGSLKHFAPKEGVYLQAREYNQAGNKESLLIIYNKNQQEYQLDLSRFAPVIKQHTVAKDIITQQTYSLTKPLTLKEKGVIILKLIK
ncbi:glycoside hydrolase family 13 protein [Shewanella sp. 10N.286.48.A6]|uniref:glycoside hydrolase family 13 protein n=1 Tax=Shewanella sp. 10N.286.48.A6 TaxID=1880833 RepID=UPI000C8258AA|nr:glycoside hydrolase family 13 protein [Shewanella sp. 10N.286.48.A6]PMI02082.1 alpha-amylase [Shewanella sp. 10N.286.48.A6]